MVKKNPDIILVLTKMSWCHHCNDFIKIYNNINSRIKKNKLLNGKNIKIEEYNMEQQEAEFAEKYKDHMSKIDGYPTVFLFVNDSKNKMQGETIEHTVIEQSKLHPSKKNMKKLIDVATDMFISKMESKYKSFTDENKDKYVNVEPISKEGSTLMVGGGVSKCKIDVNTFNEKEDYEHKYRKYKTKYLDLLSKYSK
jgi:hypothetical protein